MKWMVDETHPCAEVTGLVPGNLNTYKLGSRYDTFEPANARLTARRMCLTIPPGT